MNNARAPFNNVNLRKAVEYAIDRPAQVRLLGAYAGKRTSQMLVPGIPGYKPFNAYPLKGADVAKAKAIGGAAIAAAPTLNVIHTTSTASTNRAQVAEFNLKQVGFKVNDVPTPATNYYQVIQTKGTTYNFVTNGGWCADYFDPFDYLNVLFDGRKLQAANNNNYAYFNNAAFNKGLDHASSLSGSARAAAYAQARPRPDGQVRTGRAVPHLDEPVLHRSAREELDLQLVLRLAVPERTGGGLGSNARHRKPFLGGAFGRLPGRLRIPMTQAEGRKT